jgi:exosortase/archaeosortase family protein
VLDHVFRVDITTVSRVRLISALNSDDGWARVIIAPECASLKQWMHWLFLMILFPGPWKHKLWYIPAGLVIIEWTNVIRICGILLMQIAWPNINIHLMGQDINTFHLAHDYIFKFFFYFVIFLMWMLWVEKFFNPTHLKSKQNE